MMLLTSAPGGYGMVRFRGLMLGLGLAWLLPSLIAAALLLGQNLFDTPAMGDGALLVWTLSYLVLISPALSWLSLVLAAPLSVVLLDRGWFGWIPALALGIVVGGVLAYLTGVDLAITFGALQLMILRSALGRICPQAFVPGAASV